MAWREIEAVDRSSAVARLTADRLIPLEIHDGRPGLMARLNQPIRFGSALSLPEQALILTQLSTLLTSGLPFDRSLDLLREQATRRGQRELLARIVADVREGAGLADAFSRANSFPAYVVGVLRAAESGGGLGDAMTSIAARLSMAAETRGRLVAALSYPAAVLVATFIALGIILTLVVPQFAPIFEGEEQKLPALTRGVLKLSNMLVDHPAAAIVVGLILTLAPPLALRSNLIRSRLEASRRSIPGLRLRDDWLAAQFMGVLGTLLAGGVTAVAALPLARSATGSRFWREKLSSVERSLREGSRLSSALAAHALLPQTAIRLIDVGERTGSLDNACLQASTIIARSTKARIDRITALVNPIAILMLGLIVGGMVAGVMLGIFAIGDFAG